jgi:hypothetical protein
LTRDKDGKVAPVNAKSTRVYSRIDGKRMLVHANFAPVRQQVLNLLGGHCRPET